MKFEYDPSKSSANQRKHGVSLEKAAFLWQATGIEIEAKTADEARSMRIGPLEGKFYSCVFTRRGETLRLISARRSREKEEKLYHEHIGRKEN